MFFIGRSAVHPLSSRVGLVVALVLTASDVPAGDEVWVSQVSISAHAASHTSSGNHTANWPSLPGGLPLNQPPARSKDAHWETLSLRSAFGQVTADTSGSNTSLTARQDLLSHSARVIQADIGNAMTLIQSGEGQTLTAIQSGQQNVMSLQQGGHGNVISAAQSGTMNTMGVLQTGSANRSVVVQR